MPRYYEYSLGSNVAPITCTILREVPPFCFGRSSCPSRVQAVAFRFLAKNSWTLIGGDLQVIFRRRMLYLCVDPRRCPQKHCCVPGKYI